jgi:hypothetical protein
MAKNFAKKETVKESNISTYGSHKNMIDEPLTETISKIDDRKVVCKDDRGYYVTDKKMIDSGFADSNRFTNIDNRLKGLELNQVTI